MLAVDLCYIECERHGSCDTLPTAISGDAEGNERHGESKDWLIITLKLTEDVFCFQCLSTVVDLLAHPNSPAVQRSPTPRRGHMSWCHYSWDHVIPTLKQWIKELNGLKVCHHVKCLTNFDACLQELYAVFADVCNSLKLPGPKHDVSEAFEYSTLSCKQMSVLLKQWLLKDHNRKVIQSNTRPDLQKVLYMYPVNLRACTSACVLPVPFEIQWQTFPSLYRIQGYFQEFFKN